ncbi:hypothetical protein C8J57DRAFT_1236207 [Mycena rebaudengoi]|nr:hypothetical protein C8J57DRAFT_1236207 [Mycena rebaudengoi]
MFGARGRLQPHIRIQRRDGRTGVPRSPIKTMTSLPYVLQNVQNSWTASIRKTCPSSSSQFDHCTIYRITGAYEKSYSSLLTALLGDCGEFLEVWVSETQPGLESVAPFVRVVNRSTQKGFSPALTHLQSVDPALSSDEEMREWWKSLRFRVGVIAQCAVDPLCNIYARDPQCIPDAPPIYTNTSSPCQAFTLASASGCAVARETSQQDNTIGDVQEEGVKAGFAHSLHQIYVLFRDPIPFDCCQEIEHPSQLLSISHAPADELPIAGHKDVKQTLSVLTGSPIRGDSNK